MNCKLNEMKRETEALEKSCSVLKSANANLEDQLKSQRSDAREKFSELEKDSLCKINHMAEKIQFEMKVKYESEIRQKDDDLRNWSHAYEALERDSANTASSKAKFDQIILLSWH
jgi:hypothetical protein